MEPFLCIRGHFLFVQCCAGRDAVAQQEKRHAACVGFARSSLPLGSLEKALKEAGSLNPSELQLLKGTSSDL